MQITHLLQTYTSVQAGGKNKSPLAVCIYRSIDQWGEECPAPPLYLHVVLVHSKKISFFFFFFLSIKKWRLFIGAIILSRGIVVNIQLELVQTHSLLKCGGTEYVSLPSLLVWANTTKATGCCTNRVKINWFIKSVILILPWLCSTAEPKRFEIVLPVIK